MNETQIHSKKQRTWRMVSKAIYKNKVERRGKKSRKRIFLINDTAFRIDIRCCSWKIEWFSVFFGREFSRVPTHNGHSWRLVRLFGGRIIERAAKRCGHSASFYMSLCVVLCCVHHRIVTFSILIVIYRSKLQTFAPGGFFFVISTRRVLSVCNTCYAVLCASRQPKHHFGIMNVCAHAIRVSPASCTILIRSKILSDVWASNQKNGCHFCRHNAMLVAQPLTYFRVPETLCFMSWMSVDFLYFFFFWKSTSWIRASKK